MKPDYAVDMSVSNASSHIKVKPSLGDTLAYEDLAKQDFSSVSLKKSLVFDLSRLMVSPPYLDAYTFFSGVAESSKSSGAKKKALDDYLQIFQRVAQSEPVEYGVESLCDELIAKWSTSCDNFGDVINHIFLQTRQLRVSQVALLKALSHLSYDSVYPQGQTIALAALGSTDCEVAEAGIRAFENWGHKEGVACLDSSSVKAAWLEQYRIDTLNYLREL